MQNSALREKLNSVFQEIFAIINIIFILTGKLGIRLSFYDVLSYKIYNMLSNLARLNNEQDITMSYLYRDASIFIFWRGLPNLFTIYLLFLLFCFFSFICFKFY